jgi:hypothetical protein
MNIGRGTDKPETETPKEMAAASVVMGAIDMDWELSIMRERMPVERISIRSKICSVVAAETGRDSIFIVSRLFPSSKNVRQVLEASHSLCFLHPG